MMLTILLMGLGVLGAIAVLMAWHLRKLFKGPDYDHLPAFYPFKSEASRQRYLDYYEQRAKTWPGTPEARALDTAFGATWVRSSGPEDAPPLVLLPSGFASSLIWLPNIAGLLPHFRIHAVDNVYDVGRSVNTRPVTSPDHLVDWLDEVLAKLCPQGGVNLMGLSFGGWLASQYALRHPERLRAVVLAAPAATLFPLPGAWAWRAILGALPPQRFFMNRFVTSWMCRALTERGDEASRQALARWMDDALIAMKCFAFRMPVAPTVLSDDELRSFAVPVKLVLGEYEVVYPAERALERVRALAPAMKTALLRQAGHDLTIAQTDAFNREVIEFLRS